MSCPPYVRLAVNCGGGDGPFTDCNKNSNISDPWVHENAGAGVPYTTTHPPVSLCPYASASSEYIYGLSGGPSYSQLVGVRCALGSMAV